MSNVNTYLIDPRSNGGEQFTVEAADHGQAAQHAAAKIFPRFNGFARRESGSPDGSGMFKCWRKVRGSASLESDHGSAFHVLEL